MRYSSKASHANSASTDEFSLRFESTRTVYVLNDRCSHEDFSLSEGEVDVETAEIECARHGAMFRLSDGEPISFPATKPVQHYDVQVANGRVGVVVP